MLKFNNTHIFTGHIKQLLSSFNLPKYKVYTQENRDYLLKNNKESPEIIPTVKVNTNYGTNNLPHYPDHLHYVNYIKDNLIQRYVKNGNSYSWEPTNIHYHANKHIPNHTKNLIIKNNEYDSYTHEYLGDYLRFVRDYYNLNLMSMYNCFSNNICSNLKLTFSYATEAGESKAEFNSFDSDYKIYMLPVKLFKEYTIAIDSSSPVEMFVGVYHKYLCKTIKFASLYSKTYKKYNSLKFSQPILYNQILTLDNITDIEDQELAQYESDLKLFIKISKSNESSVVVLEGNYLNYNDAICSPVSNSTTTDAISQLTQWHFEIKKNKTIINIEDINNKNKFNTSNELISSPITFKPISALQLLKANTKESYPFADRLMEYLSGNVITGHDQIYDNVVRVQEVMSKNGPKDNKYTFSNTGEWEQKMQILAYSAMVNSKLADEFTFNNGILEDCLGYIDKDTEKWYSCTSKINDKYYTTSISKVNIYSNIYKAQAKQLEKQKEDK